MSEIRLGILSDDKLDYQFVVSLLRLADARGVTKAIFANGDVGRLDEGRNRVAAEFLKTDAEWLLWLDTDMVFTPVDFDNILRRGGMGNPIVTGLYYRASDPPTPCAMRYKDGHARVLTTVAPNKAISVDTAGFGFMLTHREVLEKMAPQYNPTHPWFDNGQIGPNGQALADDSSFCFRAKELGYDIILDTSIRLGHIKAKPIYG